MPVLYPFSMSIKETVNLKYSNMCAELGHVIYTMVGLETKRKNLEQAIAQFETTAKSLLEQEQAQQQALAVEALKAQAPSERPEAKKED